MAGDEAVDARPLTSCGNPFGGCALCNPEQTEVVEREREERERLKKLHLRQRLVPRPRDVPPPTISDFDKVCPQEFSKSSALKTAASMRDQYGAVVALKRARRHQLSYLEGSWGWKHWEIVSRRLRAIT